VVLWSIAAQGPTQRKRLHQAGCVEACVLLLKCSLWPLAARLGCLLLVCFAKTRKQKYAYVSGGCLPLLHQLAVLGDGVAVSEAAKCAIECLSETLKPPSSSLSSLSSSSLSSSSSFGYFQQALVGLNKNNKTFVRRDDDVESESEGENEEDNSEEEEVKTGGYSSTPAHHFSSSPLSTKRQLQHGVALSALDMAIFGAGWATGSASLPFSSDHVYEAKNQGTF
jgi:hypothetical protein